MKKIISFSTICIIASILFSSCGSNLSITKRHYNKGYYVAYNKSKPTILPHSEEKTTVQAKAEEPLKTMQYEGGQNTTNLYSDQRLVKNNEIVVASNEKNQIKETSTQNFKQSLKQKTKNQKDLTAQLKNNLSETKKISNHSPQEGDGLSLFWIVILILLILWALGVLSTGFVVGSIINLLLLIALILLILWLLRVI